MAVKAKAEITIYRIIDVDKNIRYYILQSSTLAAPSKPTDGVAISSKWSKTEPSYISGSTMTLYFVDQTVLSNGVLKYSEVSKSSSYEAAKEAWNKAKNAQDIATSKPDMSDIGDYISSRGENLVTNGTCLLGDNTNFSDFTYDGSQTHGAGGSFKIISEKGSQGTCKEYIPVDVAKQYLFSYWIKSSNSASKYYDYIENYDIDKLIIKACHIMWIAGSTTTLAKELKNGDTVVYLKNVAGFDTTTQYAYRRGFIFWNYKNSKGYTYEPETYSRNIWQSLWDNGSAIDKENNTITLKNKWTHGTFPAGTSVSQCSDGGTYTYLNAGYTVEANVWTEKKGIISGIGKNNESKKFREGTAFVKVGWLLNYGGTSSTTSWLSTISLTQNIGFSDALKNISTEYYLSTSQTSLSGGSWSTTPPTWVNGKYMWSRTVKTDSAGNKTYSPSQNGVCIAGAKGDTGADGKGIKSTTITYQLCVSRTTAPTGTWLSSPPDTDISKPYLWTRTIITYTDNTTSNPAYSVSSTFDSLQIGGRNLISNSGFNGSKGWVLGDKCSISDSVQYNGHNSLKIPIGAGRTTISSENYTHYKNGDKITMSFWIMAPDTSKITGDFSTFISYRTANFSPNGNTSYKIKPTDFKKAGNGKWFKVTFTTANDKEENIYAVFVIVGDTNTSGGDVYIACPKLEKGNIATDWTPAPEDIEARITAAETSIENNNTEIALKASKTEVKKLTDDFNVYKDSTTTMLQDTKGWRFNWDKLIRTDEADVANHQDYITLQNGDIILGESASNQKLKIANDSIQFKGTEDTEITPDPDTTAWFTGKKFNINEGEIHDYLKVGQLSFLPKLDGNFIISKTVSSSDKPVLDIGSDGKTVTFFGTSPTTASKETLKIGDFASFGENVRLGYTSGRNTNIDSNGLIIKDGSTNLAQIGYGTTKDSNGDDKDAAYYTLGIRKADSVIGEYSMAEGYNTTASGHCCHAEGDATQAGGYSSHAEGVGSTVSGYSSHAEGYYTAASGDYSHAEGMYTEAIGAYSHAEGVGTRAASSGQTVVGEYNKTNSTGYYAFIVGNGASATSRSNAFAVLKKGGIDVCGRVFLANNNTALSGNYTDNSPVEMIKIDTNNMLSIGYGQYSKKTTETRIYGGNNISFRLRNPDVKWKPYYVDGDSLNINARLAGWISNSSKGVYFTIPLAKPILGSPIVSIASVKGLIIRQSGKYLYGSSASTYVQPSSYSATIGGDGNMVIVTADMSNTTNVVTNNDSCGIDASVQIVFSS